jgi:hypothetical protein
MPKRNYDLLALKRKELPPVTASQMKVEVVPLSFKPRLEGVNGDDQEVQIQPLSEE